MFFTTYYMLTSSLQSLFYDGTSPPPHTNQGRVNSMVFLWFLSIEYRETLVFHIESFLVVFWTKSSFLSLYFYFLINLVNEANPFPNWSYKFEIIFILTLRLFFLNVDLNKFVIFSDICGWWTMRRGGPSPLTPPLSQTLSQYQTIHLKMAESG